jgi:alkyl sulfatase BDS1-like metallo-beta-lactamase superfamily hydrolase
MSMHRYFLVVILILIAGQQSFAQQSEATQRLLERNSMFEPEIIKVAKNVYTSIGYQVSANSMIVGDDGVIIIDPGQQVPAARSVRAEFEKISSKPIRAIIYTHSHGDHVNGAPAFIDQNEDIEIWARSNFGSEQTRLEAAGLGGGARVSNTQGFDLLPAQKIGVGVAIPPQRRPEGSIMPDGGEQSQAPSRPKIVEPTHTFSGDRVRLEIAGVTIDLVAAPGETDDQLYVWLPEQRVVFAGDNFYQSWPNTYPLRGTARRSIRDWIASITSMVNENPLHVVGGHTTPMLHNAVEILTNYRDAMRWVHDRTIEGAKQFMTPDELVEYAALPEHLANLDYLADYYGSVWGTVRDIYAQDLGWFDGDPLNLHRESPIRQSQRIADIAGGVDILVEKAQQAMQNDDPLGAAQLAQHVMRLRPDDPEPRLLLADALAIIGERTFNAPARNYTLSYSNILRAQTLGQQ